MTYNEAINELEYQEDMRSKGIDYQVNNLVIQIAKKALEKQIAKKPTIKKSCKVNAFTLRCPNCEAVLQSDSPHCKYCGQALDWSKKE